MTPPQSNAPLRGPVGRFARPTALRSAEVSLVGNPSCRDGAGGEDLARAIRLLRGLGARVEFRPTEGPGHATELARQAGGGRVVVAGGDGTINEAVNGLSPGAELGIIPIGTSNVLARELGIPRRLEDSCRRAVEGRVRRMDLGVAVNVSGEERHFCCVAGIGLDARVIEAAAPKLEYLPRTLAFFLAGMRVCMKERSPVARLAYGRDKTCATPFAVVANTRWYGGGLRLVAEPSSSSGKLRVVVVPEVGLLFRTALLVRMLARRPLDRYLRSFAAEELRATSSAGAVPVHLDGELWGKLPVSFRVAPGALNVVC